MMDLSKYYDESFWHDNPMDYCTDYTCKICKKKFSDFGTFPSELMNEHLKIHIVEGLIK